MLTVYKYVNPIFNKSTNTNLFILTWRFQVYFSWPRKIYLIKPALLYMTEKSV